MLKSRNTKKWGFPEFPAYGKRSLKTTKERLRAEVLLDQVSLHHLGPRPLFYTQELYSQTKTLNRPVYIEEDLYNLHFDRLKIMFPQSSDVDLERYVYLRYKMQREPEPKVRTVKGKKTFFFQSIVAKGNIQKVPEDYEDWAWVPKAHFSKYLSQEEYSKANAAVTTY